MNRRVRRPGQLWSTVSDLARWAAFLAGDADVLLAAETVVAMRQPQVLQPEAPFDGYGLGLQVFHVDDRELVGHGGSVPGFLASLVIDIERGVAAIELANATAGRPFCGADLLALLEQYDFADTVSTNSNVRRTRGRRVPDPLQPRGSDAGYRRC